ncbi:uncharacterized protein FIESC28_11414 [Fusarium coffeatum]|uniref:Uncharacterized protein n=1 Tax=Fusarium coffeatum TaxID=231269 RepID=A0A366QJS8_9HYPO|nr:uncharacterized protein FIESC28_11414 [Fusarium coffeatum]RBR05204.1 hypothetical protein FIESC28_11414 [Fusarium coffeatum]
MDSQQPQQQDAFADLISPSMQCYGAQERSSQPGLAYTSSASSLYRRNHLAQPDDSTEMGLQNSRTNHSDSEGSFADTHYSYEPGYLKSVPRRPLRQVIGHLPHGEQIQQRFCHEHLDSEGDTHNLVAATRSGIWNPWNTAFPSLQHSLTTPTMEELEHGTLPRADWAFHGQQVLMPPCPQTSSFTDKSQLSTLPYHHPIYSLGLTIDDYSQNAEMQGIEASSPNSRPALNCHIQPQPFQTFNNLTPQDHLYPLSVDLKWFTPSYQHTSLPCEEGQGTSQIYEDTFQNSQAGQAQLELSFLRDCAYGSPLGPSHTGLNLPLSQPAASAIDDGPQTQSDSLTAGTLFPADVSQGLMVPVLPTPERYKSFFNLTCNLGASKAQDGQKEHAWLEALNITVHDFHALFRKTKKRRPGPSGSACVRCSFEKIKPLLYAIFQMLTILRLLRLGWQFDAKASETLDMNVENHENSPWDGRNPVPRMISNQLTIVLEERMINIDNWVTKRFNDILTKRVRLSWIEVFMSTFVYAHVRELDAGRNIHWSRHPESNYFWSHPKKPSELLGEGVVDCNVMLSQVYAVCKPEKDFKSWDDYYRRKLAEPHKELQTMVEKLQCFVTKHRHEGWIGRQGKQEYVEGDSSSVSYTMSSLVFCTPDQNPVVDNFE